MTTMDDTQSRPLDLTQGQGDVVQAYEPGDAKIQIIGRGEQGWRTIDSAPKDGTIQIPLTRGLFAVADQGDKDLLSGRSWQARERRDGKGFYAVSSDGVRMHRLLMDAPEALVVDHIDGDGLNNCRSNLRIGTQSQNCVNRQETPGVFLRGARPKKGKWQAYIKFNGKQRSLGYYGSEAEAHEAYLCEARRLHGDWMPLPSAPGSVPTSLAGQESDEVRRLRYLLGRAKDALSFYASAGKYLRNYHNSYPDAEYDPHMNYGLSVHHKMHHVETAAKVFDEIEAALSAAPPQPTAGGDAPTLERLEQHFGALGIETWTAMRPWIVQALSAERARVIALETALRGAIANLEHVSVFDEADDDDQEAIEARSAWQRDLDRFRAALLKASPGGTE